MSLTIHYKVSAVTGEIFSCETNQPASRLYEPSIARSLAEEVAQDFHDEHDGWECTWPLTFTLLLADGGVEIGRFSVERETVPEFTARRITEGAPQ